MGVGPIELVFVALYLLPLAFLVLVVRRVLRRLDHAAEVTRDEPAREERAEMKRDMTEEENAR